MSSLVEDKSEKGGTENVSVLKEQAVEGCNSDTPRGTNECHGEIGQSGGSGIKEEVMTDGEGDEGQESDQHVVGSGESADGGDDSPGSKSELVVLDEVDESLDGKEDNGNTSSTSKEVGFDANTSSDAGGSSGNTQDNQKKNADDPYAYVKREDFTSEKYKIEIRGLPRFYGYGELKKFLNDKLKLSSHKMKPTRNKSPGVFVCFKNEEDRQAALKTLNNLPWKGKMLTAMLARPAPDPLVKKRKLENEERLNQPEKKPRLSDDEKLRNSTTPYWNLSYDEQLRKKYDYVMKIMCKLADQIMSVNPMLVPWIKRQKAKYNGMACNLLNIRKSPICDGYRNKCEFTIGIKQETKQRMVGFRLGSYVQGQVGVGAIDSLKHIPQRMKDTVKVFEKFIKESDREPFNPETHTGHWRQLTLRLTTLNELMAIVLVNSKGASADELASAKTEVKAFFEDGEGKNLRVNSLFFQAFGRREAGKEPPKMEHLLGSKYITESILGLKFRISPEAFFQVNTPGAGILYSTVGEMVELNPSTTIVDVCCGTGTIGLSLAKDCGQVLGLEVVAPAIADAKVNAAENNITNVEFFTGRAEEILTSVLSRAKGKFVHAIVDPPRSGLQQKAIISLRGAEVIDKVVYVSCDPNAALKNFVDLARLTSKAYRGYPLVPVAAIPVDMFPHTAYCEVVMLFQRINPINLPKTISSKEDDIAVLSASLSKSPQVQPPDSETKEGNATETRETKIIGDSKNSGSVSAKDQKGSTVLSEQEAADKQRPRRRRPGRSERLRARNLFGLVTEIGKDIPISKPEPKVSAGGIGKAPTATNKPATMDNKPGPKNKIPAARIIGKLCPKVSIKRDKMVQKDHFTRNKPYAKLMTRERNLNPILGNKRRWKKDEPFLRDGGFPEEELWKFPQEQRGVMEGGTRMRVWRELEGVQHSRSSPEKYHRDGTGRRSGVGPDENIWLRLEHGARDRTEERERNLLRGGEHLTGMEMAAHEDERYNIMEPNYGEDRPLHVDVRSLEGEPRLNGKRFCDGVEVTRFGRVKSERTLVREPDVARGKRKWQGSLSPDRRNEGDEFREGMESKRWGPLSGDARCGNIKEDFNARRRKYSDEVQIGRPNNSELEERPSRRSCERFNRRSPEMLKRRSSDRFDRRFCETFEHRSLEVSDQRYDQRFNERFDRRSGERLDRRSSERFDRRSSERFDRRSSERFDQRSPERFDRRSSERFDRRSTERFDRRSAERFEQRSAERFDRRSTERFDRRSTERFDRRSAERFDRRSPERFDLRSSERFDRRSAERLDRSPCEKCVRRSSERICRPHQHIFVNDVHQDSRQESVRSVDDFISNGPNELLQERETIASKYPQHMELALHHQKQYNESATLPTIDYRDNRNNNGVDEREYLSASSSPRKMVGIIGSLELHRKNEVYVYRGPNDASLPLPLALDGRIPVSHSSAENRANPYEKRHESNMPHRIYDDEEPGVKNDHSVISRRVEVIRRPFIVDGKYGMLLDTSGEPLGSSEVLVVTAKNQMYDGDRGSQFSPNEGISSTRILEHREMSVMRKPWNADNSPPPSYTKCTSPVNKFDNHHETHSGRLIDGRPQGNCNFEWRLKELPGRPWGEMERLKPVSNEPSILDANMAKFSSVAQDVDERHPTMPPQARNHGSPNEHHHMEKSFSYPMSHEPKAYLAEQNSQFPPKVAGSLGFYNNMPEHSLASQNAPFSFVSPANSRMHVPSNLKSLSVRPNVFTQNPFMGSSVQGTQQVPLLSPKQPLPMQGHITDIPRQQRMPSIPSSAPNSVVNSWNFKGNSPWSESNQQMRVHQKHW